MYFLVPLILIGSIFGTITAIEKFRVVNDLKNITIYTAGTQTDTTIGYDISDYSTCYLNFAATGTTSATFTTSVQAYYGKDASNNERWATVHSYAQAAANVQVKLRDKDSALVEANRVRFIVAALAADSSAPITYSAAFSGW